jgi:hypothetical protein
LSEKNRKEKNMKVKGVMTGITTEKRMDKKKRVRV